jgi:hypothetical protein
MTSFPSANPAIKSKEHSISFVIVLDKPQDISSTQQYQNDSERLAAEREARASAAAAPRKTLGRPPGSGKHQKAAAAATAAAADAALGAPAAAAQAGTKQEQQQQHEQEHHAGCYGLIVLNGLFTADADADDTVDTVDTVDTDDVTLVRVTQLQADLLHIRLACGC